ncbi:MAG: aminopeptidase [Anaerolineales bacterium]|nr:aminopeptidase [Anaerolineae bacterium]PWB70520.1 MAG: aminopeptidase [Anaerolineales bacterium]
MSIKEQHQELLKKYAEAIVKVGLNLRKGQRLIITNAVARGVPPAGRALVHEVAKAAYAAGARYVDVIWGDEEMLRIRLQNAPADSFSEYPKWHVNGIMDMFDNGDALLSIYANDPDVYAGLDPERVGAMQKSHLENYVPINIKVSRNAINWCIAASSAPAWAAKIFPDLAIEDAEDKLWDAIFDATRIDQPDPIAAWMDHIQNLTKRGKYLQAKKYSALHYKAPGTDLTLGLPQGHRWISARMPAENGIDFTANMPTEEVFTLPDCRRAEGTVAATFPLSYGGSLIDDFSVTFKEGKIVKVSAKKNETILQKLVDTDEGSKRLGEVALVPASSPIAKRGHLFYNTLFDENASCHIAIGRAYRFTIAGGEELNDEEFLAAGGNVSLNHVDFMIGSPQMDIDGIKDDGTREPVMRQGEWAFDV